MDPDEIFRTKSVSDVRTLEVDLRSQAAQKRTALRLLVGESYRDLLRTADTVVQVRDAARQLKQDIVGLGDAAEGGRISQSADNLRLLDSGRNAETRDRVCRRFLTELRGLVIHYVKHDVVTAALVYELGRRISKDVGSRRLAQTRRILRAAIDGTSDLHAFSCAHAVLEGAGPADCLRHHLSLQRGNLCRAISIPDLVQRTMALLDAAQAFADLGLAFEQLSRTSLIDRIAGLPDVDGELLRASVSEAVRQTPLELRIEDLSARQAKREIERWLSQSGEAVSLAADTVLSRQSDLATVLSDLREVRRTLDTHGLEDLYPVLERAVGRYITKRSHSRHAAIDALHGDVKKLLERPVGRAEDLWTRRLRWEVHDLEARQREVRSIVRGGAIDLHDLEAALKQILDGVRDDLKVLKSARQHEASQKEYESEITAAVRRLHDLTAVESDVNRQTAVRLSRIIRGAWPISVAETKSALITVEVPAYAPRLDLDLGATFEDGRPRIPSSSCTTWLTQISDRLAGEGLDLVRAVERGQVRAAIAQAAVQSHSQTTGRTERLTNSTAAVTATRDDSVAAIDSTLPQHRANSPSDEPIHQTKNTTEHPTVTHVDHTSQDIQHAFDLAFVQRLVGNHDPAGEHAATAERAVARHRVALGMLAA